MIKDKNSFFLNSEKMLKNMINNLENVQDLELDELNPEKTMHVIMDMNNGFAKKGALYSERVEALIPKIASLTERGLERNIITGAYTDCHCSRSPELESFPQHCMADTEESEVVDELKIYIEKGLHIWTKNSTNGIMSVNPLNSELIDKYSKERIQGLNTFIITGCVTDICVYQFTLSLKAYLNENNIKARIIVPIDCVDTFDIPGVHDAEFMNVVFLNSMLSNGIEVVNSIK